MPSTLQNPADPKAGPHPDAQPLYRCYSKTEKSCQSKKNCIDLSLKHLTADVTHTSPTACVAIIQQQSRSFRSKAVPVCAGVFCKCE